MFGMRRLILFGFVLAFVLCLPFVLGGWVTGSVNDSSDGISPNDYNICMWGFGGDMNDCVLSLIGPSGPSGTSNIFMIDSFYSHFSIGVVDSNHDLISSVVSEDFTGETAGFVTFSSNPVMNSASSDSCTCTDDQDWEIDMGDNCSLATACSPLDVTFINTGTFTCNALLNASSVEGLSAGQHGLVEASCQINIY